MKYKKLTIILCFCFFELHSQNYIDKDSSMISVNYIEYHRMINNAELYLFEGNKKRSEELFLEAFNKFQRPFTKDLVNASIVTSLNKKKKITSELVAKCFSLGIPLNLILKKKIIKHYLGKKEIKASYLLNSKNYIVNNYRKSIDSLLNVDQSCRRENKDIQGIDKTNTDFIFEKIKINKFPSEYLIGYHQTAFLLFHHNAAIWGKEEYYSILINELKKGNIHPSLIALVMDRKTLFDTLFKERYFYLPYDYIVDGKLKTNQSVLPIDNFIDPLLINKINERRTEIGFKTVEQGQKLSQKKFTKKYQLTSYKFI